MSDTYLVSGVSINVTKDDMPLLQNNLHWIKEFNKASHVNGKWVDSRHRPDKGIFYCGKKTTDTSCIQFLNKILKKCGYDKNGITYWTYDDGVFFTWNSSKALMKKTIKSCGVDILGSLVGLDSTSKIRNILLVTFIFIFFTSIPLFLSQNNRRKK